MGRGKGPLENMGGQSIVYTLSGRYPADHGSKWEKGGSWRRKKVSGEKEAGRKKETGGEKKADRQRNKMRRNKNRGNKEGIYV